MYCIVLSIRLFSNEELIWCFSFRNLQAIGYHVPPSVDTTCFPWILIKPEINLSAISMFLSLDIDSARICLFSGSIAAHNQEYSEPTLSNVSSMRYSDIFVLLVETFRGLYLWIQFQIATWLLLIICKKDNALAVFLSDKQAKNVQIQTVVNMLWRCSLYFT